MVGNRCSNDSYEDTVTIVVSLEAVDGFSFDDLEQAIAVFADLRGTRMFIEVLVKDIVMAVDSLDERVFRN